ncbi:hypothetical protein RKD49_005031 [Streptomyces glaucescens]
MAPPAGVVRRRWQMMTVAMPMKAAPVPPPAVHRIGDIPRTCGMRT